MTQQSPTPVAASEGGELRTRPYESGDEPTVVAMYEPVFGRARPADEVARRLEQGPAGPAQRQVMLVDEELIGHTALLLSA